MPIRRLSLLLALVGLFAGRAAGAQETVPQPAQSMKERQKADEQPVNPGATGTNSWNAPPTVFETTVKGERLLVEEERIGEYEQPRWTAKRRFPTTRIYVIPKGTVQFEWWLERKATFTDLRDARYRSQYEFEFGLGHRLQLDLYLTTQQKNGSGPMELHQEKVELRYALADWGVIPANPTLYVELVRQHDGPPKAEGKLLLGGELRRGWHWGANLVFERELGGSYQHEYVVTGAVAYSALDQRLSIGAELKAEAVDEEDARFDFSAVELLGGPSVQWRPVPAMHVDLVVLFGVESERTSPAMNQVSAIAEPLMVVGWEF